MKLCRVCSAKIEVLENHRLCKECRILAHSLEIDKETTQARMNDAVNYQIGGSSGDIWFQNFVKRVNNENR